MSMMTQTAGAAPAGATARPKDVQTIQFLRFVAATMVLIAHVSFYIHNRVDSSFRIMGETAQGVALFFVISGFIMTVATGTKIGQPGITRYFILSRLIRIVPLYWAVNAAKLIGLAFVPGMIVANPTVSNIVYSLLFLPAKNADGKIEAFYGVGWSLNYEMAFYALFALTLFLGKRPDRFVIPVLMLATAASFLKTDDWPAAGFLLSPALLNFIWGILIGDWYLAGRRMPAAAALTLIVGGMAAMFVPLGNVEWLLQTQLHMGAVVLGFVALEGQIGHAIPRLFIFLGDASYSLYLTHPMFGVLAVVAMSKLAPWMSLWGMFAVVTVLCLAFSAASYQLFEKPVTVWLRKRLLKKSVARAQ